MKYATVLTKVRRVFSGLRPKRNERIGKLDFGILQVAMMVAALDGEVAKSEIETLQALAKRCRGYTAAAAQEAFEAALRSAGYLSLLAKVATRKQLLSAFVNEAMLALPSGFIDVDVSDVRRAFVMWTAMAMGDGDYSEVEREAIVTLKNSWAEMKTALMNVSVENWFGTQSTYCPVIVGGDSEQRVKLLTDDFLVRVESALAHGADEAVAKLIKLG